MPAAVAAFTGLAAAFALAPQGRLACEKPYTTEVSPDGKWTLTVCAERRLFSMPGGGSDGPGWIVLRDDHGAVRNAARLDMVQLYGTAGPQTRWTMLEATRPMVFALQLHPARNALERWWDERVWRLRALLGLAPGSEALR